MSRSTFSVLFYVNRGKEKNGIVPVMARVSINCTQSQFSCKKSIPLALWDAKGRSNLFALHSKELCQRPQQGGFADKPRPRQHQGADHQALPALGRP